ncbi:MAG: hypothetical protein COV68_05370 [Nitrospirae bacterium CG11_big_fil_rev_8_21_14_0_20_41_14]|nr:MAG: hypothetical protein COV68_05370 [Nitrospirae bacterium CG11_big_fil_rev_8_21_14_0_20_41_14]
MLELVSLSTTYRDNLWLKPNMLLSLLTIFEFWDSLTVLFKGCLQRTSNNRVCGASISGFDVGVAPCATADGAKLQLELLESATI